MRPSHTYYSGDPKTIGLKTEAELWEKRLGFLQREDGSVPWDNVKKEIELIENHLGLENYPRRVRQTDRANEDA